MEKSKRKQSHSIVWNKQRRPMVVPLPNRDDEGNQLDTPSEVCLRIEPGINRLGSGSWEVAKSTAMISTALEDPDVMRELGGVGEIPSDMVDHVLRGCASMAAVRWWSSVEGRTRSKAKIEAWIDAMQAKFDRAREDSNKIQVGVS